MANIYDFEDAPARTSEPKPAESPLEVAQKRSREKLSVSQRSRGRKTLFEMVEIAFQTLEEAMIHADHPTAVKAAQILLDRAGFGPKSSVDVNHNVQDLSALSREELAERALKIHAMLKNRAISKEAIDVTPSSPVPTTVQ